MNLCRFGIGGMDIRVNFSSMLSHMQPMIQFLKEVYFTFFTLFFRVGIYRWPLRIEIAKAVTCVTLVQAIILMIIQAWIEIYLGTMFSPKDGKWVIVVAFLALGFANNHALVTRGNGVRFEREFNKLEKPRKNLLVGSFVMLILIVIAFFFYTVDAFQHSFHIIPKRGF